MDCRDIIGKQLQASKGVPSFLTYPSRHKTVDSFAPVWFLSDPRDFPGLRFESVLVISLYIICI